MRHFLHIADYSAKELQDLLDLALALKKEWKRGGNKPVLKGKVLGMVFQKPSLRTRVSFDMAMRHLGGALTIVEHKGKLKGLRVTFIGDGNNVATSLLHICARLGAHFTIASPEGYELPAPVVELGRRIAADTGTQIRLLRDPHEAVRGADVVYTDAWTSMGQEAETEKRKAVFPPYQVNAQLVSEAGPEAIVMHCLPAHRGQEITDEVADGPHSAIFPQAENRMHAQKAILAHLLADAPRRTPARKTAATKKRPIARRRA